jgi:hypothetical protein
MRRPWPTGGAVAPKEGKRRLEKDCFPTQIKSMPHVSINIYLSSITYNFLTSPSVFVKQNGVIGIVIKLTLKYLGTARSFTLLPTKKYREGTQLLLHEQFSTATTREPVMDLPRTADSVIHCTWQPQNPSETPPGPA